MLCNLISYMQLFSVLQWQSKGFLNDVQYIVPWLQLPQDGSHMAVKHEHSVTWQTFIKPTVTEKKEQTYFSKQGTWPLSISNLQVDAVSEVHAGSTQFLYFSCNQSINLVDMFEVQYHRDMTNISQCVGMTPTLTGQLHLRARLEVLSYSTLKNTHISVDPTHLSVCQM
jgi:hypothetical protein